MRSIMWLTTMTLVASAVATVAVVDYGQRHTETAVGQFIVRLRGGPKPEQPTNVPPPTPVPPEAVMVQSVEPPKLEEGDKDAEPTLLSELKIMTAKPREELRPAKPTQFAEAATEAAPSVPSLRLLTFAEHPLGAALCFSGERASAWCDDAIAAIRQLDRDLLVAKLLNEEGHSQGEPIASPKPSAGPRGTVEAFVYLKFTPEKAEPPSPPCDETPWPEPPPRNGCCRASCEGQPCGGAMPEEQCGARTGERPSPMPIVTEAKAETPKPAPAPVVIPIPIPTPTPVLPTGPRPMFTRFYHVDDLLTEEQGHAELMEVLQKMVAPDSWLRSGGMGEVTFYTQGRTLIVRQNSQTLEQVEAFLNRMRERMAARPTSVAPPPFFSVQEARPLQPLPPLQGPLPLIEPWAAGAPDSGHHFIQLVGHQVPLGDAAAFTWLNEPLPNQDPFAALMAYADEPLRFTSEEATMPTPLLGIERRSEPEVGQPNSGPPSPPRDTGADEDEDPTLGRRR